VQETVQVKINSSNLVELFNSQKVNISKIHDMPRRVGLQNPRYLRKYFKYCKRILDFSIQYNLQHVVKISANSEMVKWEALSSWAGMTLKSHVLG